MRRLPAPVTPLARCSRDLNPATLQPRSGCLLHGRVKPLSLREARTGAQAGHDSVSLPWDGESPSHCLAGGCCCGSAGEALPGAPAGLAAGRPDLKAAHVLCCRRGTPRALGRRAAGRTSWPLQSSWSSSGAAPPAAPPALRHRYPAVRRAATRPPAATEPSTGSPGGVCAAARRLALRCRCPAV